MAEPGDYIEIAASGAVFKVNKEFSIFTLANRKPLDIFIRKMYNAGWLSILAPSFYLVDKKKLKIIPNITLIKNN